MLIVFAVAATISLFLYEAFEVVDQEFIEPVVASNLKLHNYRVVNEEYCSSPDSENLSAYACELRDVKTVDENTVRKIFGKKYRFKKKWVDKNFGLDETIEPDSQWFISLLTADVYDAYMMEYSSDYLENWDYSVYDMFENYRIFSARFATAIFTARYDQDRLIFKDNELLIVSRSEKNLLVRKIYGNVEEYYVFSL